MFESKNTCFEWLCHSEISLNNLLFGPLYKCNSMCINWIINCPRIVLSLIHCVSCVAWQRLVLNALLVERLSRDEVEFELKPPSVNWAKDHMILLVHPCQLVHFIEK